MFQYIINYPEGFYLKFVSTPNKKKQKWREQNNFEPRNWIIFYFVNIIYNFIPISESNSNHYYSLFYLSLFPSLCLSVSLYFSISLFISLFAFLSLLTIITVWICKVLTICSISFSLSLPLSLTLSFFFSIGPLFRAPLLGVVFSLSFKTPPSPFSLSLCLFLSFFLSLSLSRYLSNYM